jgi:hypothetical protein
VSASAPAFFGGPLLDFSWFGSSLLVGGVIVGILAVAAFVVLVINQERPRIAPVAVQAMSCTGVTFVAGIVASWVGVMLLV